MLWSRAGGREKIMKVMGGWLVCRRIMPSAERLCAKFHSFPRSLASQPAVHLSDNLSALGIILQKSSKPERGFFVLKPSEKFLKANARRSFLHILRIFSCFFVRNCQPAFRLSVTSLCKTYYFVFHARLFALINSVD